MLGSPAILRAPGLGGRRCASTKPLGEPVFLHALRHFNGGLFEDPVALDLDEKGLKILLRAAEREWAEVEPSIFGTLLERALDPKERHKLGAHFTRVQPGPDPAELMNCL